MFIFGNLESLTRLLTVHAAVPFCWNMLIVGSHKLNIGVDATRLNTELWVISSRFYCNERDTFACCFAVKQTAPSYNVFVWRRVWGKQVAKLQRVYSL